MRSDLKLIYDWVDQNYRHLNLHIKQLDWTKKYGANIFDFESSIEIDNSVFIGRSADFCKELAIVKSIVEALERSSVPANSTSSGFAAHLDEKLASLKAKNELIEHDLFLRSFHSKKSFKKITRPELRFGKFNSDIDKCFQKVDFYLMNILDGFYFTIARIRFNDGIILGIGSEYTIEKSCEKSFLELIRKFSYYKKSQVKSITLAEFSLICNPTFFDHGLLALNGDYNEMITFLFDDRELFLKNDFQFYSSTIFVSDYTWNHRLIDLNIPLYLKRAESDKMIKLYTGIPKVEYFSNVNLFAHNSKNDDTHLMLLPHPIA